jgi:glycosyltransferase involved in cell wall biosynthesis
MTVFFNVTDAIGSATPHGITRTERSLAIALDSHPDVRYVTIHNDQWHEVSGEALLLASRQAKHQAREVTIERLGVDEPRPAAPRRASWSALGRRAAPATVQLTPCSPTEKDVFISVGLDWLRDVPRIAARTRLTTGARFIGMCYDTIPIDHPEWVHRPDPGYFHSYLSSLAEAADRVLCISETTRADLLRHVPRLEVESTATLRLGADLAVNADEDDETAANADLVGADGPFALYCSTIDRRKNHQTLYRAMRRIAAAKGPGRIVMVGKIGHGVDDLLDTIRHDAAVAGRFVHVGNCSDALLAALYRRARFAVYPSLYEGWGLGVTEALAHRCPVLIANGSALDEAGMGECVRLDALDSMSWSEHISAWMQTPPSVPPDLHLPTWSEAASSLMDLARP